MSAYAGPNTIEDGLVLSVDAGNTKSYPGSGTTLTDLSGNRRTGTLTNITASGGQLAFNGTTSSVDFGNVIGTANMKTLSAWVKFNDLVNRQEIISKSTTDSGVEILVLDSNISFFVMGGTGILTSFISATVSSLGLTTSNWYNLVGTQGGAGGTAMNFYLNGISIGTNTTPTSITDPTNLYLGRWNTTARFLNGNIAVASIYNRALTAAEVQQNFNALRGRFGI